MKKLRFVLQRIITPMFTLGLVIILSQFLIAQKASISTSDLYRISDGTVVVGAQSQLVRNRNGLTATVHTSDLAPGGAYTLWWIIFNYPQFCSQSQCTLDDAGNPLVQASAINATGNIVGTGTGNFGAWIGIGGPYSGEVLFGPGLLDPIGADVLLIVRYHGPAIPGMIKQQMTTYQGGCSVNTCSDEQFAYHAAQ